MTSPCLAAQSTGSFLAGVQKTTVHVVGEESVRQAESGCGKWQ